MSKRFTGRQRPIIYQQLVDRDGNDCRLCRRRQGDAYPKELRNFGDRVGALEIDHVDGNPKNNSLSNLRLLCKACNVAKGSQDDSQRAGNDSQRAGNDRIDRASLKNDSQRASRDRIDQASRDRIDRAPNTGVTCVRVRVNEERLRLEMGEANYLVSKNIKDSRESERKVRDWIVTEIKTKGYADYDEAIDNGAEIAHRSQDAVKRYIRKMVCRSGPCAIDYETKRITFKEVKV